jgi:LPS-assembly lipoprotein
MSSSDRRKFLALVGVLPLAACGFTPVYGPAGTGGTVRGRVAFAEPDHALAFDLVSRLEDRIGRTEEGAYLLDYAIRTSRSSLAISETEDINRINITGTVDFTVTHAATGAVVQRDEVSTFSGYATSGSPVATAAARRDAEQRLMVALADQIVARLLAGADDWT